MGKEKDFTRKSNLSQLSDDEILQGFKVGCSKSV